MGEGWWRWGGVMVVAGLGNIVYASPSTGDGTEVEERLRWYL